MMKKVTLKIQGTLELRHMPAVKKIKMTVAKTEKVAKRQSLKVISVGKKMNIMIPIMRVMNQIVSKNSAKRIVYITVKGIFLKIRIVNIEKMKMIQVMK